MNDGNGELVTAVRAGDLSRVRRALDAGADVNVVVGDPGVEADQTPLGIAAHAGHYEMAELLLQRGADPSPPEGRGGCIVSDALVHGHHSIADLLYRYGGKAYLLNGFCFTNNYAAICEILHREPHRWPEYAGDSIRSGNVEMLADNLRRNPMIDPQKNGFVFLRSAIVQWRLMHRIRTDGFDRTRYQLMLRMLLDWGVDPNVSNDKGETNLHMCASYGRDWSPTEEERIAHATLLLERGADVNARSAIGETPLDYAVRHGRAALASLYRARRGTRG